MPLRKITAIALAALIVAFSAAAFAQTTPIVVDPAIATMTPEQLVETRQAHMKQNGGILRGAAQLSGADAVAAATTLLQNFTDFPALFVEGSVVGDSKALPAIWERWDEFNAILVKDQVSAAAALAAAEAGDTAAFGAAIQAIGGSCGECHQQFRG
ncbi:MAG: cytochrome c [Devosia sp.]